MRKVTYVYVQYIELLHRGRKSHWGYGVIYTWPVTHMGVFGKWYLVWGVCAKGYTGIVYISLT